MTCRITPIPGGFIATCTRGRQPERAPCSVCKARPHTQLCDFELRGKAAGRSCDAKLCASCAVKAGPGDRDLCPAHAKLETAQTNGADR